MLRLVRLPPLSVKEDLSLEEIAANMVSGELHGFRDVAYKQLHVRGHGHIGNEQTQYRTI